MIRLCARVLGLSTGGLSASGQQPPQDSHSPAMGQNQDQQADKMGMQEEAVAHPFFTHMEVPEGVGVFNLRLAALATRVDGRTEGDFAFHFETKLTEFVGLHVRNDRFLDNPLTDVMFQFAAVRSKSGMSGFSPIIEFEFPTGSGGGNRTNTLVGFSSALANSRVSFNQVLHYNPREDMVDGSAALVFKAGKRFYPARRSSSRGHARRPAHCQRAPRTEVARERAPAAWPRVSGTDNKSQGLLVADGVPTGRGMDSKAMKRSCGEVIRPEAERSRQ